jgi:hypothetical protein
MNEGIPAGPEQDANNDSRLSRRQLLVRAGQLSAAVASFGVVGRFPGLSAGASTLRADGRAVPLRLAQLSPTRGGTLARP